MKFFRFWARLIFGITFVVSGWLKIMDPTGTGLIVSEYLKAAHLGFLSFSAVPVGITLSTLELLLGISVLLGFQMRIASVAALVMTSFFTLLSAWLYAFDPIADCGCFGEAIHLTNAQTFWKNIVLLLSILLIFFHRRRYRLVAPRAAEWTFLGLYFLLALGVSLSALIWKPWVDFGDFKIGTPVLERLEEAASYQPEYVTTFIYEKEGLQQEFPLEQLPDSTWTFVDSKTQLLGSSELPFDFPVKDAAGNYVVDSLLNRPEPLFTAVVYRPGRRTDRYWEKLGQLQDSLQLRGASLRVLMAADTAQVHPYAALSGIAPEHFLYSDYKTLIALSRSNGGVVYWNEAVVIKKWSFRARPLHRLDLLEEDAEIVAANGTISQQLICEGIILISILSLVLMRYVCGIVYDNRRRFKYLRRLATRRLAR